MRTWIFRISAVLILAACGDNMPKGSSDTKEGAPDSTATKPTSSLPEQGSLLVDKGDRPLN